MSDFENEKLKELFSRVFVLAVENKFNYDSFTYLLERSEFALKIEKGQYDDYFNKSLKDIFFDITNFEIKEDNSYGVFNDAYWCGYTYFELFTRLKKPFNYIFLKLPFPNMLQIYSIYHEMDISSLIEYFSKIEKKETILKALRKRRRVSLPKLSQETGIALTTLSKYNASDESLLKASFQAIYIISSYFDVSPTLFVNNLYI